MQSTSFGGLFKQAKESGALGSVFPEGDYILEVVGYNVKEGKNGKPDSIGLQLEAVETTVPETQGRKSWTNLHFTEKALPISYRFLIDVGLPESFIEQAESAEEIAQALVGVRFDAEVSVRESGQDKKFINNNFKIVDVPVPPVVAGPQTVVVVDEGDEPF